ncbi:MAG TPA: hypothetical protein VIV55_10235 [Flavobacterium sp.]
MENILEKLVKGLATKGMYITYVVRCDDNKKPSHILQDEVFDLHETDRLNETLELLKGCNYDLIVQEYNENESDTREFDIINNNWKNDLSVLAEEIEENNKLMAEFLGAKPEWCGESKEEFDMNGCIGCLKDEVTVKRLFQPSDMLFDSDWNWLMEVVEKLENLGYVFKTYGTSTTFLKKGTINEPIWSDDFFGEDRKENTYDACVELIKWHNYQQNK